MSHRHSLRLGLSVTAVFAFAVVSPPARAEGPTCGAARDAAREAEHANHLRRAASLLQQCSKRPCSDAVRQECSQHYSEIEAEVPTIVPKVTDPSGAAHTDVQVKMDGEVLAQRLTETPLAVDPGLHDLSFSVGDKLCATQRILIAQGAHERSVPVALREQAQCGGSGGAAAHADAANADPPRAETTRAKDKHACMAAREAAQAQQQAGHLRAASEQFATCATRACGPALLQQCTLAFEQLESDIPTVVPRVTDNADGAAIQVQMDGQVLVQRVDGQPVAVDPGLHEFSFSGPHGVFASRKVMIAQGVHELEIPVSMHEGAPPSVETPVAAGNQGNGPAPGPAAAATPPPADAVPEVLRDEGNHPRGGSTPIAWTLGALGVAGLGVGAAFLATGPHSRWNVAVASGALGLGALTAGIWLLTSGHPAAEKAPEHARVTFDVAPTDRGAFASVSGSF
jgi:hypothetical protein